MMTLFPTIRSAGDLDSSSLNKMIWICPLHAGEAYVSFVGGPLPKDTYNVFAKATLLTSLLSTEVGYLPVESLRLTMGRSSDQAPSRMLTSVLSATKCTSFILYETED